MKISTVIRQSRLCSAKTESEFMFKGWSYILSRLTIKRQKVFFYYLIFWQNLPLCKEASRCHVVCFYDLEVTRCDLVATRYYLVVTRCDLVVTRYTCRSYKKRSTIYEIRSRSYEKRSRSYAILSRSYEIQISKLRCSIS